MLVRIQSGGITRAPEDRQADSVVVCLDDGKPIVVAVNIDSRVWVYTASDPQFAEAVETLGFNKRDLPPVETVKV